MLMKVHGRILFLWMFYSWSAVYCQPAIDSLEQLLAGSEGTRKVDLLNELSYEYLYEVTGDRCVEYASQAMALADEIGYEKGKGDALNRLGSHYHNISAYDKALDYFLQSLAIREKINDTLGVSASYSNIALIYYACGDIDKTIDYAEKSLQLTEQTGDKRRQATVSNNLAVFWLEKGNPLKASKYARDALDLYTEIRYKRGMAASLNNLGDIYVEMKKYDDAIVYHRKSLAIYEEMDDRNSIANSNLNIGQLYLRQGNIDQARRWLTRALDETKNINSREIIRNIYEWNARLYEQTGDYGKALDFYILYSGMNDSIFNEVSNKQIAELQVQFESANQAKEIQLLNQERTLLDLKIRKQQNLILFFSIITGMLILTSVIGLFVFRFKKTVNAQLKEKNTKLYEINRKLVASKKKLEENTSSKDRYFNILALDLINPFRAVLQLAETIHDNHESMSDHELLENAIQSYLTTHNLFYLLENLLYWSRIQSDIVKQHPKSFPVYPSMMDLINALRIHAERKNIHMLYNIPAEYIVYADQQLFNVVFRNLLYNAVKYSSPNGKILIEATRNGEFLAISVKDHGIGMEPEHLASLFSINNGYISPGTMGEHGAGLGLILAKIFTESNNGILSVQSETNKGSTFRFTVPLKKSTIVA